MQILEQQPQMGRPVEIDASMKIEVREWVIDFGAAGYVARYRIEGDNVVILAVRHQLEDDYH